MTHHDPTRLSILLTTLGASALWLALALYAVAALVF